MTHKTKHAKIAQRRATVIFWLLLCLMVIIAIVALVLDGGRMLDERRRLQTVADASALAAAAKLRTGYCWEPDFTPDAKAAALQIAAENGIDNSAPKTTVTIHIPPSSGAFAGLDNYAEVIIETEIAGTFSSLVTQTPLRVRARAVAQSLRREVGILVLKNFGQDTLFIDNDGTVDVQGAPIFVNSKDPLSYRVSNTSTVIADSHEIVGDIDVDSGGKLIGPVKTGVPPQLDLLHCLPKLDLKKLLTQKLQPLIVKQRLSQPLKKGVYKGGLQIVGDGEVFLEPGNYVFDGGLHIAGNGKLFGEGVTIFNTGSLGGKINITGDGQVKLTAPKNGTYAGISIFQAAGITNTVKIIDKGNVHLDGIVYVPKGDVELSVLGTDVSNLTTAGIISQTLHISGDGSFRIGASLKTPSAASVRLVE